MTEALQRIRAHMTASPVTITPDLSVADARDRMLTNRIRHLPVVEEGRLVGLVTDRDLAIVDGLSRRKRDRVLIHQIMRARPFICGPEDSLVAVARLMIERRVGSVIVVENGAPIGVFTTIDALRRLVEVAQLLELMGSA